MLDKVLNYLFGIAEEINGNLRCPTYLYRWTLLKGNDWGVYLHHFVGDDWSFDLHDHPKRFISIGLWGSYVEETPCGPCPNGEPVDGESWESWTRKTVYRAPWIRSFPAEHIHRLSVPSKNCWTLVAVLHRVRDWGFWHEGRFIPWLSYVRGDDKHVADKMKACE
jgi:hypothetical protein